MDVVQTMIRKISSSLPVTVETSSQPALKFAKNLSPDKINLSTLKGEGQLTNLELDEEVLQNMLDLPTWLAINKVGCNKAAIRGAFCRWLGAEGSSARSAQRPQMDVESSAQLCGLEPCCSHSSGRCIRQRLLKRGTVSLRQEAHGVSFSKEQTLPLAFSEVGSRAEVTGRFKSTRGQGEVSGNGC
ncbi:hypothetical protein JZ751_008834 [Albula glossodonta]|uniref:Uncharacterized protein n=1 Tax=Albula glossodonta TaxID=121402 RepID=A0A8T2P1V2_9TELE|nr:hypothetical protein JZ751_008834 [Albula glossodonta]